MYYGIYFQKTALEKLKATQQLASKKQLPHYLQLKLYGFQNFKN